MEQIKNFSIKFKNIFLMIFLYALYLTYSSLIFSLMSKLGIVIEDMKLKSLIMIPICISFMLIIFVFDRKSLIKDMKSYKDDFKRCFRLGIKCYLLGLCIMITSNNIIYSIYHHIATNEESIQQYLKLYRLYVIFSSLFFAPFIEEFIFRKMLRKIIDNKYLYIILSGLLFGAMHCIIGGFNTYEVLYIIPYGIMGMAFAYLYYESSNIFIPMTFHFMHNLIVLIISLI